MRNLYNRYIPQSDGSYRRHSIPQQRAPQPPPPPTPPPMQERPDCGSCPPQPPPPPKPEHRCPPPRAGSYLKNLLPADLDTEDLLVILLLLLMTGEGREDGNLPLLTLALYLFL